jgi:uncharacterized C2H2 Zn-finger protein
MALNLADREGKALYRAPRCRNMVSDKFSHSENVRKLMRVLTTCRAQLGLVDFQLVKRLGEGSFAQVLRTRF